MLKGFVDRLGFGYELDSAYCRLATPGALQGIDFDDSAQQLCPSAFCLAYGLGLDDFEGLFFVSVVSLPAVGPVGLSE